MICEQDRAADDELICDAGFGATYMCRLHGAQLPEKKFRRPVYRISCFLCCFTIVYRLLHAALHCADHVRDLDYVSVSDLFLIQILEA